MTSFDFALLSNDLFKYQKLAINNGILIEALCSGKLSLIQNDALRNDLGSWGQKVEYIKYIDKTTYDGTLYASKHANTLTTYRCIDDYYFPELGLGSSAMSTDINDLLNDRLFENQVGWIFFHQTNKLKQIDSSLLKPCDRILRLLENEMQLLES